MAGELTTVFDEQVPLLPQDKEGKPELYKEKKKQEGVFKNKK